MKTLGICTIYKEINQLTYEQREIYLEAKKEYDRVLLVNPRLVNYLFIRDKVAPIILHKNEDISSLSSLSVRSTKNSEAAVAILVRSLKVCGCDILDPIERFSVGKSSKLLTTISRFKKGIGTSTYISFTRTGANDLLRLLHGQNKFPLLTKPIAGSKGQGVERIDDLQTGLESINRHFGHEEYLNDPFYFQNFVSFQKEYRVLIIDGETIGIVEKIKVEGKIVANAAQGGTFVSVEAPHIIEAVLQNVSKEGLLGVDVAIDQENHIHIIETNRAPQWQEFEKAIGLNVAQIIVEHAIRRLN